MTATNSTKQANDFVLKSQVQLPYNRDHCLSLWYFEDGEGPFSLQFGLVGPTLSTTMFNQYSSVIENRARWNAIKVLIPVDPNLEWSQATNVTPSKFF